MRRSLCALAAGIVAFVPGAAPAPAADRGEANYEYRYFSETTTGDLTITQSAKWTLTGTRSGAGALTTFDATVEHDYERVEHIRSQDGEGNPCTYTVTSKTHG